jgi:hypothetical protein
MVQTIDQYQFLFVVALDRVRGGAAWTVMSPEDAPPPELSRV